MALVAMLPDFCMISDVKVCPNFLGVRPFCSRDDFRSSSFFGRIPGPDLGGLILSFLCILR